MPVKVYSKAHQKVVEVDAREAQRGIQQGDYDATGTLRVAKGNRTGTVDAADLLTALGQGASLVDEEGSAQVDMRREEESLGGQIQGGAEALAAGASLGLSSAALEMLGADSERMAMRRDVLGKGGTALELAGAAVPTFFSGGGSLAGRGLAAQAMRSTPAALLTRGAARFERGLAGAVGRETAVARILPSGARNFVEGAVQAGGAQLDENVLGDRELNADLLGAMSMGGLFGAGAGYGFQGLAAVSSGTARASVNGMRGVIGRMNAATGGLSTREVAEWATRQVDDIPGRIERAADELPEMWRTNAIRQGLDEETAGRLSMLARTPEGRSDLARIERDWTKIEEEAVGLIGQRIPSIHAQMDEARRLAGGASKSEYWKRLGPKTIEAQRAAVLESDALFTRVRGTIEGMAAKNRAAVSQYGGGATFNSSMLSQVNDAIAALERRVDDAGREIAEAGGARRLSYDDMMSRGRNPRQAVDTAEAATQKAMAVDKFKRKLGEIIDENGGWGKMRNATPEQRATNIELRRMYHDTKKFLERGDLWGDAAAAQAKINAAYATAADADDLFREAAAGSGLSTITNPDGTFNAAKALKLVRAHGKIGGDVTVTRLSDALDARVRYFDELAKHVDMDEAGTAALGKLKDDVKALKVDFRRQAKDAALLDDMKTARAIEGSGSPSLLTAGTSLAGIMGFGIGGVPGAVLGAGLVAARQPYTSLRRYAALRSMLDKQDIKLSETIKKMLGSDTAKAIKAGAKKVGESVRAGATAVGEGAKAVGRGTVEASRRSARATIAALGAMGGQSGPEQRRARREAAIERAVALSSSPDAIERALAVPHADIHDVAPGLSGTMQQRAQNAAKFLQSKAPKVYTRGTTSLVDPLAEASFERYLDAVADPIGALAKFESGRITNETAEAIRVVYPALYADIQQRIQQEMADAQAEGREIPYDRRIRLGGLFQSPTDPSLRPMVANEIQMAIGAAYDEPDAAQAMSGASKPGGAGQFDASDRKTQALLTPADRAGSWRSA